jgi:hypothetical protein
VFGSKVLRIVERGSWKAYCLNGLGKSCSSFLALVRVAAVELDGRWRGVGLPWVVAVEAVEGRIIHRYFIPYGSFSASPGFAKDQPLNCEQQGEHNRSSTLQNLFETEAVRLTLYHKTLH